MIDITENKGMQSREHGVRIDSSSTFENNLLRRFLIGYLIFSLGSYGLTFLFLLLYRTNRPLIPGELTRFVPVLIHLPVFAYLLLAKSGAQHVRGLTLAAIVPSLLTELAMQLMNHSSYVFNFFTYVWLFFYFGILLLIFFRNRTITLTFGAFFLAYGYVFFTLVPDRVFTFYFDRLEIQRSFGITLLLIVPMLTVLLIMAQTVFNSILRNAQNANERLEAIAFHDSETELPNLRRLEADLSAFDSGPRDLSTISLACLDLRGIAQLHGNDGRKGLAEAIALVSDLIARHHAANADSPLLPFVPPGFSQAYRFRDETVALVVGVSKGSPYAEPDALFGYFEALRLGTLAPALATIPVAKTFCFSVWPADCENAADLTGNIQYQLYQKTGSTAESFQPFNVTRYTQYLKQQSIKKHLHQAFELDEFYFALQPQVDFASGKIAGFEALARWKSEELGIVSPAEFIPLLEESGLIERHTDMMLSRTVEFLRRAETEGIETGKISVNLSPRLLGVPYIEKILRRCSGESRFKNIEFEITEGSMLNMTPRLEGLFSELRDKGIWLSIDDFGTGYSNLAYLMKLKADVLKIDKRFIDELPDNDQHAQLVGAILTLAGSLGMKTVAEGVENPEQAEFLRLGGCDIAQGYYYFKPLEPEAALEALKAQSQMPARTLVVAGKAP